MEKQYLYILSNPRHEGLFKVGGTGKNPAIRADQLSRQTGVIGKFQVEWSIVAPDWRVAESMAHFLLRDKADEKEYFKLNLYEATKILTLKLIQFFELEIVEVYAGERLKEEIELEELKAEAQLLKAKLLKIELDDTKLEKLSIAKKEAIVASKKIEGLVENAKDILLEQELEAMSLEILKMEKPEISQSKELSKTEKKKLLTWDSDMHKFVPKNR